MNRETICGIYKIESPSGKIYIGQSEDVNRRWRLYNGKHIISDLVSAEVYPTILRRSFKKYGVDKHIFEIVEACQSGKLNEREMFWISFYDSYNTPHGMNCTKGGDGVKGFIWSEEARLKASLKHKGQIQWNVGIKATPEHLQKNSQGGKAAWLRRKGSQEYYSEEQRKRRSVSSPNKKTAQLEKWKVLKSKESFNSKDSIEKRSMCAKQRELNKKNNGYKVSDETKARNSAASLKMWENKRREGKGNFTGQALQNMLDAHCKIVLNTQTGIFYLSVKEAAQSINCKSQTLSAQLRGVNKNRTSFIYA